MTLMINDIADVINISVSNPAESEYDIFVGLEHYDVGEPIITRYGSTKMLTTACKKFSAGDILLARRNVYLRRAGLVKFDGLTSGDSIVIRIKPNLSIEGVNSQEISRLLPFVLNTNAFWDFANTNSDGTMSKRLSPQMLLSYEFNLPPFSNQKPLADKLWAAYSLKASKLKLIDAIDEMVKSQFIEMFGNQNTNDKQWTESLVKDEFKLSMGKTPARSNPECWENGTHRWISISDMATYTRYTGDTGEYITDYAITDSGIKAVPKGTIIMSFKLSIGRTAITSEDIYTNEAIMAFADFDEKKFDIDFLHFLIANKNWLLGAKQAVKGKTLNKESIGNAKIIIPPIEMQEEFASIYNQADKSKFELKKSIEAIDKVIKSLINNI